VFFHLYRTRTPQRCFLFDRNQDLIDTYRAIANDVNAVIRALSRHRSAHSEEHYYRVRAQQPNKLAPASRAARLIYLNKTCYNGLYRVNSRNQFNVPMGRYKNPRIFDPSNLRAVSTVLKDVSLESSDFTGVEKKAKSDDFIYFDPPYQPASATASFTAYTDNRFNESDQSMLAGLFNRLSKQGCKLMLSNSDTPLVRELYAGHRIVSVKARRAINARADRRGAVGEVVVLNYDS